MNAQPTAEVQIVFLARVASRRVVREAREGDDARAGPQQLERGLKPDLHPRAGHERHPSIERCGLEALVVVEVAALQAQRVVERVQPRVGRLADVAGPRLLQLRAIDSPWGGDLSHRGLEYLRLTSRANPAGFAQRPIVLLSRLPGRLPKSLLELPLLGRLGVDHAARRDQQRLAFLEWQQRQQRTILHDGLERGTHAPHLFGVGPRPDRRVLDRGFPHGRSV